MLLHSQVSEPKLPVTGTGQSGNKIEVILVRSMRTARRADDSRCASICFYGEEFLRWRRTSTGVDSGDSLHNDCDCIALLML
jgi:hypothetical protein